MPSKPLHSLIQERSQDIVERFVDSVREHELPARPMSRAEIIDHLHLYLAELVKALRHDEQGGSEQAFHTAAEHGLHRWTSGYSLQGVIGEYGLLREIILDIGEQHEHTPGLREIRALERFLTRGISDSTATFVQSSHQQIEDALAAAHRGLQARDEVLAIVSHDLKNPLSIINGNVEVLMSELARSDSNAGRERLQRRLTAIQRASRRMDRLITDLLDLARLKGGEFQLHPAEVSSAVLVRELCEESSSLAEERAVRFTVDMEQEAVLHCDQDRILQVLQNLVGNALKFTPSGGAVVLKVRCAECDCSFEVVDSGPGIPAERLPYLFNRFWQAPDTAWKGSGLGLAIAKGFVELHGGSIWVESVVGQGSTFGFKLPRQLPQEAAVAAPESGVELRAAAPIRSSARTPNA
ncbi:MAG TPA: sensor histidine kinase [Polyangiaceae bacterium]|nr:sensor histidine kinase [Polyangiaceae bacterium]